MNTLTTIDNGNQAQAELAKVFPFARATRYTLGGEERASIAFTVSKDDKATWANGILENSRYAKFMLDSDGSLKMLASWNVPKFRASKVKDINHALKRLNDWAAIA
jgi:hypothetical protein